MSFKKFLVSLILGFLAFSLVACTSNTTQPSNVKTSNETHSASSNKSAEATTKEIYNDSLITVSFLKKYDIPELQGMFYFDIKAENESNQKITIYLQDTYVNDTMFTAGSGTPLELLPGKSATHSFFGKYEGTGATTTDKIKKIGFKICVMDENSKNIETTEVIQVSF